MKALTKKQKFILDFIHDFIAAHGYSPSVEEIARGVGLKSKATVHAHLKKLQEKGFIRAGENRARSIELIKSDPAFGGTENHIEISLLGTISAGKPIEAVENRETISLPPELMGRGETYVLKVRGDSMIEEHILDGDYVIVERRSQAQNGDTVVALIDGIEATIKKLFHTDEIIRLEPRNPTMKPMEFSPNRVLIQGVVIGILRKMKKSY